VALLDQLDGAVEHASQPINFADVAKTSRRDSSSSRTSAAGGTLQLLSSAGNEYTGDYSGEDAQG